MSRVFRHCGGALTTEFALLRRPSGDGQDRKVVLSTNVDARAASTESVSMRIRLIGRDDVLSEPREECDEAGE